MSIKIAHCLLRFILWDNIRQHMIESQPHILVCDNQICKSHCTHRNYYTEHMTAMELKNCPLSSNHKAKWVIISATAIVQGV